MFAAASEGNEYCLSSFSPETKDSAATAAEEAFLHA